MASHPNYLFEARTLKSNLIKQSFEAIKDFISEGNLVFDQNGITLKETDTARVVYANMTLFAKDFEFYYCQPGGSFECGIGLMNFNKIMKMISNDDILTFFMDADETNELGIVIENANDHRTKTIKFKLLDLETTECPIPPINFDTEISLPSQMFQKICRDFSVLGEAIEIRSIGNRLIFACNGQIGNVEEVITENNNNHIEPGQNDEIIQGIFSIKHLVSFTKCSNLCNTLELYIRNDFPLIIKYSIGSMGTMLLCLAPRKSDD